MKNHLLLIISVALLSIGCYEDKDETPPPTVIIETTEVIVNTSISGAVLDSEGMPLSEYTVVVNDQFNTITSDNFYLELDNVQKKGQTFHIIKDNKQIGIQTQLLVENDINHMKFSSMRNIKKVHLPEVTQKSIFLNL